MQDEDKIHALPFPKKVWECVKAMHPVVKYFGLPGVLFICLVMIITFIFGDVAKKKILDFITPPPSKEQPSTTGGDVVTPEVKKEKMLAEVDHAVEKAFAAASRNQWEEAAGHYAKAAEIEESVQKDRGIPYRLKQVEALYNANWRGDRTVLDDALRIARTLSQSTDKNTRPNDWLLAQKLVVLVLIKQAELPGFWPKAVEEIQSALQAWPMENSPRQWADAQIILGNLLIKRNPNDAAMQKGALQAYKLALQVYTKEETPKEWAALQVKIGHVFRALSTVRNRVDFASMEEAAKAYKLALQVYTEQESAQEWATAQFWLASALFRAKPTLSKRDLAEAEKHCRFTLKVLSDSSSPSRQDALRLLEFIQSEYDPRDDKQRASVASCK